MSKSVSTNSLHSFLALLRAGLWEQEVSLSPYGDIDFEEVYKLAFEQSVIGIVAAGLEHVVDLQIPEDVRYLFLGDVLQLEAANTEINSLISDLEKIMQEAGIYVLLVKGQGIAQCYERPLWRSPGDVDFLLDDVNYPKANLVLSYIADKVEEEDIIKKHLAMSFGQWTVELHGTLRGLLWHKLDAEIDEVQRCSFLNQRSRTWKNGEIQVLLPEPNDDILFTFAHILQHYFKSGIGIRQICDWCRLLWAFRNMIDIRLLSERLMRMEIMTEWKAFAAFTVLFLGMPESSMPLYSASKKWTQKAYKILLFILETGSFGHNRENDYIVASPLLIRKAVSLMRHTKDCVIHFAVFPKDAVRVWWSIFKNGIQSILKIIEWV